MGVLTSKSQIKVFINNNEYIVYNLKDLHYHDRLLIQSLSWLNGNPLHNEIDGECCIDFSCCEPDLFTKDLQERKDLHNKSMNDLRERRRK